MKNPITGGLLGLAAGFLACAPAQATVFSCRNERSHVQFKVEDGEWYQRPSSRYAWHYMGCSTTSDITCGSRNGVHSWQKTMAIGGYVWEFLYENSGRWTREMDLGSGYQKTEGTCEIEEDES